MTPKITPKQQMLIIEKLYYSTDSITSTRKFNKIHGEKIGKIGKKSIHVNEFYKMLKKAGFLPTRCKKTIEEISGKKPTIY